MLIVAAAELPCSLKAKIATLRLLGAARLLLVLQQYNRQAQPQLP